MTAPATARPSYGELLRDPRWQRKRLEVMQREDFTCQNCGAKNQTLNVHHRYYAKGMKPWEYDDDTLHCLCEPCHEKIQTRLTHMHWIIGMLPNMDAIADADSLLRLLFRKAPADERARERIKAQIICQWEVIHGLRRPPL
jgi:5-methylcytosine-specific restriction endonuclease McrA